MSRKTNFYVIKMCVRFFFFFCFTKYHRFELVADSKWTFKKVRQTMWYFKIFALSYCKNSFVPAHHKYKYQRLHTHIWLLIYYFLCILWQSNVNSVHDIATNIYIRPSIHPFRGWMVFMESFEEHQPSTRKWYGRYGKSNEIKINTLLYGVVEIQLKARISCKVWV